MCVSVMFQDTESKIYCSVDTKKNNINYSNLYIISYTSDFDTTSDLTTLSELTVRHSTNRKNIKKNPKTHTKIKIKINYNLFSA